MRGVRARRPTRAACTPGLEVADSVTSGTLLASTDFNGSVCMRGGALQFLDVPGSGTPRRAPMWGQKGTSVGLFNKKQKVAVCEMCGKADFEGCGSIHNHVVRISIDQPAWLPANRRAQAPGEYTWMCLRCNSYPSVKWPSDSGAWAGMLLHLGGAHYVVR